MSTWDNPYGLQGKALDLWQARQRDQVVITAMQRRASRNPIRDLLWRRPWRSPSRPTRGDTLAITIRNYWQWLRMAHDCADPAVGCSCTGGFRFPHPKTREDPNHVC
jgi:hypothetical protein